jgi:hypothetical protein
MQERERERLEETALGPSESGKWVTGQKGDEVKRSGKENYGKKMDGIT